ncbi:MAG: extracellular solute-binding protein [Chloroflexi bacterium]|nr:extracellular solute-binding protein [Chloroflexota bacterium]
MSKRNVCLTLLVLALLAAVAACAAPTPPPPQIVQQTVVVEKQVQQTVVVPVQQTVVVEKQATVVVPQTVVVQQTAVPAKKTIVTIAYNGYFNKTFGPADPPIKAIQAEVAKKYPDIQVVLNVMPYEGGPWHDTYVAWFQGKDTSMDLIGVSNYWLPEFAQAGWLLPLDGKFSKDYLSHLTPAFVQAFSYKGQLMGLGPWWGGIGGLYYRKDLLTKYNLQPPKTYDDLVKDVKTIQAGEPGMSGWTWPALKDQVLVNQWVQYLNGYGGSAFDANGKCAMNNAQGVAALKFMKSLFETGVTPKEALTWKEEESLVRFASGTAIFHSGRQDMTFWLDDAKQSKIPGKWGFLPSPAAPTGKAAGYLEAWAFSINKFSANPDAAAKVLEVMFDFNVQKAFNLSQGPLQANMDIYKDADVIKNNPNMPLIQPVLDTAVILPTPKFSGITLILEEELSSALTGSKTAEAALNDSCQRIDTLK